MAARESGLGEESTMEYGERTRDDCQENAARQPPTPKHNHPEAMPQPRSGARAEGGDKGEEEWGRAGTPGVLDAGGTKVEV